MSEKTTKNKIIDYMCEYLKTNYLDTTFLDDLCDEYKNILIKYIPIFSKFKDEINLK